MKKSKMVQCNAPPPNKVQDPIKRKGRGTVHPSKLPKHTGTTPYMYIFSDRVTCNCTQVDTVIDVDRVALFTAR